MIIRTWRGSVRAADTAEYLDYLEATGLRHYRETPGHVGTLVLQRQQGGETELLLLTAWESQQAIRAFAGDDIERAVFYPEDDRFLVERGERVHHFTVARRDGAWLAETAGCGERAGSRP